METGDNEEENAVRRREKKVAVREKIQLLIYLLKYYMHYFMRIMKLSPGDLCRRCRDRRCVPHPPPPHQSVRDVYGPSAVRQ